MTMTVDVPAIGDEGPDCAIGPGNASVRLASLWVERPLVLVFLPDDESPFCTDNATQLRDNAAFFEQAGTGVAAVLPVGPLQASAFAQQWNLAYTVLPDARADARAAYGLGAEQPGSFIIDRNGIVRYAHRGASVHDYPPTWELVQQACQLTGRTVEPPKLSAAALSQPEAPPMTVERGAITGGAYQCAKCGHAAYEIQRVSATGGIWSRLFNLQLRGFTAITCTRCTYTELYKTETGAMANVIDLVFGR